MHQPGHRAVGLDCSLLFLIGVPLVAEVASLPGGQMVQQRLPSTAALPGARVGQGLSGTLSGTVITRQSHQAEARNGLP